MRDLEQQISEWRRQMRAAGIKASKLLDELESHLRDDMEQQMRSGAGEEEAFAAAVRRMGRATELHSEFQKVPLHTIMKPETHKFAREILCMIAIIAVGMALVLPAFAQWRAHELLAGTDVVIAMVGAGMVLVSILWAATRSLKRFKA